MTKPAQAEKTQGQKLYEADVERRPNYHDGAPRKTWDQLNDLAKWSWERPLGKP